jgi:hypothetical protein
MTQSGHYWRPINSFITNSGTLTSIERPVGLEPRCSSPFAQRREHSQLGVAALRGRLCTSCPSCQHTLRYLVDMNANGDGLGQADPLEGRIGIDEKFGAARVVAIGDAAADALDMPRSVGDCCRADKF